MSHSSGEVIHNGKIVGYFEYNGTADFAMMDIHPTAEERNAHWREECTHECTCGKPPEDVILYTSYGMGFHYKAKACLSCMVIVDGFEPYRYDGPHGEDLADTTDHHPLYCAQEDEGAKAKIGGLSKEDCPYPKDSHEASYWVWGYFWGESRLRS